MKNILMSTLLLSGISTLCSAEMTVKPAGVQIVWDDGGDSFGGFTTFNTKPGVNLALHIHTDSDSLIGIDQDQSKVTLGGAEAQVSFFGSSSSIAKDGKTLKLEINAKGAQPVDGKFKTTGAIVVTTANGKTQFTTDLIDWKKGTKVQFPKEANLPPFEIKSVGKPSWGDEKWEVTLNTNQKFESFISVTFIDDKGKEHKANQGSSSSMSGLGMTSVSVSFKAPETISKAKMVVEVWKGLKKTTVPVHFTLGASGAE